MAPALAQASGGEEGIPDVVVTAERRPDEAQNIGIALSVIDGDTLAARGVTSVNQLQFQTPSLEVIPAFGGGQPQFKLRGVGFEDYAANNTPTVGIYVDEVAYPVPAMTQSVLFDVARVEVLRGPQGTLYGRNTTGGAINFITRRPTDTFSAGIEGEYGRFDQTKVEGFVSGPLTDTLKVRLSGVTEQGGGFQRNRATGQPLGDADRLYGRALVDWAPTAGVDLLFNLHGGRDKSEATGLYLFRDFPTHGYGPPAGPVIPADSRRLTGWGFSDEFARLTGADADDKPHRDNESWGTSLNADVALGDALRLTSITAYDHLRRREYNDWDASASRESDTFWGTEAEVFAQELRLAPATGARLNWVAGSYYSYQKIRETFITDFTDSLGFFTDTNYRQTAQSISGFGQADYALTGRLKLTVGGRYEHEKRKLRDFATEIGGSPTFTDGDREQTLSKWSGKIGIDYRVAPDILLYASASRGVKSGGFTAYNSPSSRQINAFRPETLYAYEAGFKADISRQVRLNGSAFYYDYRDQQVLGVIVDPDVGAVGKINNAPKSKIYGGEVELELAPAKGFRITQSIGYKQGEYVRYVDVDAGTARLVNGVYVADTVDLAGRDLPLANWSYQGSASYTLPLGRYALEAAGDYAYRDALPSFLGPTYRVAPVWLANATLTLRPEKGRWYVGLYGRNIFNEKYDLTRNYFLPNASVASPGRPATYGVRAGISL
ncbi:TonB-dependent receptor [Sphingomonas sp.]|uniref:TonB-dependent receptor n=1 Tax=Sphingomonas sp. TaxID=28214 RepID=UPI003B3B86D2